MPPFYILSKTFDVLFMPLPLAFMLLVYAVLAKNKKRAKILGVGTLVFLYLVSNQIVVNKILEWWENGQEKLVRNYKVGVVLTGSMTKYYDKKSDIVGGGISVDRAIMAFQLYQQHKIEHILITGGPGKFRDPQIRTTEAQATKMLLMKMGVDSSHIFLEELAVNTRQNAVNAAKILEQKYGVKECALITSAFHIPRAALCFKKVGISAFPVRTHYLQNTIPLWFDKLAPCEESLFYFYYLWHEWIGIAVYKLSGYI